MKKFFCILFIIIIAVIIIIILINSNKYDKNWQEVVLDDVGIFKIPKEWTITEEDGFIFIYNKDKLIMVEYDYCFSGKSGVSQKLGIGIMQMSKLPVDPEGISFSNSARCYYCYPFLIDGEEINKFYIEFDSINKSIGFVIWDDSVSRDLLAEICNTFSHF